MKIIEHPQGSVEWLAHRAQHFNASDAPAMLGVSPYKTRASLLREMHTGVSVDVDIATQKRFDNGHRAEALARPLAEQIIGQDLYPVVGAEGRLSASFDGLTLDESVVFEHKALNDELRAAFRAIADGADQGALPIHHRAQMEQQLMISGAERALFMSSEWTADGELVEERHCWYMPDDELRGAILKGWLQFAEDLAAYTLPQATEAAPVGKAPETLPALRIEVTGQVTASNLAEFKQTALATIRSVNRELRTDQDFADAEKAVKWCSDVESRLESAKEHALSQTASIDALFKALDDISAEARTVRLDLGKLVARRKTEVKEEAVARSRRALDDHIAALNAELAPFRLPPIAADFAGTIKGLKSVASMQDKLDGLLATTKIAADVEALAIRGNIATFKAEGEGFEFLFADLGQVIHKGADDFRALVQGRIAQHKVAEAERERKKREQYERNAAEQRMAPVYDRASKAAGHDATYQIYLRFAKDHGNMVPLEKVSEYIAALDTLAVEAETAAKLKAEKDAAALAAAAPVNVAGPAHLAPQPAPGLAFDSRGVLAPVAQPRADEPATLKLGDINARLHPLRLDAAGLAELGIQPARQEGAAKLYRPRDYERVLRAIAKHVDALQGVMA